MCYELPSYLIGMAYLAIGIFIASVMIEITDATNRFASDDKGILVLIIFMWPILLILGAFVLLVFIIPTILGATIGGFIKSLKKK